MRCKFWYDASSKFTKNILYMNKILLIPLLINLRDKPTWIINILEINETSLLFK